MTEWVNFVVEAVASLVRIGVGVLLLTCILPCRKEPKRGFFLCIPVAVFCVAGIYVFAADALMAVTLEVVSLVLIGRCFFEAETRLGMFVTVLYEIAVLIGMYGATAGCGILLGSEVFPEQTELAGRIALAAVHVMLLGFGIYIGTVKKMSEQKREINGARIAAGFVLVCFMVTASLMEQEAIAIPQDTRVMYLILSMVLMAGLLVFHMRKQYETEQENARLKTEQAELLEREYKELNRTYAANAKLFHDLHNHIGVLQGYLKQERMDEAKTYLDELQAPILELANTVWSGDEAVDYLLNQKIAEAKNLGIAMVVSVEFPRHTNIKSVDLSTILGNLLDNAIEAAKQVPEESERKVTLTIRRIYQMLVIKTENTFVTAPVTEDGTYRTTKKEGGLHGWGLKSAETAAEKYNGTLCAGTEDGVFRTVVTLYYEGVER